LAFGAREERAERRAERQARAWEREREAADARTFAPQIAAGEAERRARHEAAATPLAGRVATHGGFCRGGRLQGGHTSAGCTRYDAAVIEDGRVMGLVLNFTAAPDWFGGRPVALPLPSRGPRRSSTLRR